MGVKRAAEWGVKGYCNTLLYNVCGPHLPTCTDRATEVASNSVLGLK